MRVDRSFGVVRRRVEPALLRSTGQMGRGRVGADALFRRRSGRRYCLHDGVEPGGLAR